jgi:hypothetical protein
MRFKVSSAIMRTTLDISDPVLAELKRLQSLEGKSMGALASELLAQALADRCKVCEPAAKPVFRWASQRMGAKVDISDKSAVLDAMEKPLP